MNRLRSYAGRRLELGDMLRAALHLARSHTDAESEDQARTLLARLAADRFRLAVAGQFSRGKSTLMNALLGGAYLPMGALPMTSVITTVRYGNRPKAMVRRHQAALPVEVPLAGVAEFVAASSLRRAEMRVATVEVQVPAEILRLGFEFVDTPGVGSAIAANTAITRQFLPEADAVIFVTSFDSPLTEAEAGFLAEAYRHAGKLFLVLNKRDLVEDREAADVQDFVRRRLSEDLGVGQPRVFGLSALEALEAVIHNDQGRLAASGLPGLRGPLEQFLTTDKTRLFLRNVSDRGARLVSVQQRDLRLGRLALDGGPRIPEVLTAFDARVAELASLQRATASQLTDMVNARLPGLLAGRGAAWRADLGELLAPAIEETSAAGPAGKTVGALLDSGRALLEQAGPEVTGPWLLRRAGEVHELLTGMAAAEIGMLLQTARSPGSIGAQIAGLAEDDGGREPAGWSAQDLPDLTVRAPRWSVPVEHPRRARRKAVPGDPEVRHRLADALDTAVTAFEERTRAAFLEAAREWVSRLAGQAGGQLGEAAERFRRCLRTPPAGEDLAALEDLSSRLEGFRAALVTEVASADDAGQEPPGGTGRGTGRGDCVVCTRMEKTLGQQLRHGQFLLATRESAQERHTLAGGYCPPHTWQYASVASPVGISAAYAKLTAAAADALEAASERGRSAEDLGRAVAALTPPASECALCRALTACEREAIADIAPSGVDSVLCLRHLALALNAGLSAEVARSMLRALAGTLRRDSEDMRGYALKREALRSGLVSDEESRAHLEALRRLAGLPALALPWTDVDG